MKALSIRNLRKTYRGGFEALKGIDLDVATGDFFALLGPNGAGKSTAIGIICSLVNETSGTVSIFGADLKTQRNRAKSYIGLVPQEINFNQFETVRSVVVNQAGYYGISRKKAMAKADQCIQQLGLWDKRNTVSRKLSGGMKRRLMIARALVHSPKLLILDEPTAGVDIEIRRSMWEMMQEVNDQGTTIILTTHYLEEAESLCRNIAIINHGHIVEHTDMAGLLEKLKVDHFVLNLKYSIDTAPKVEGYRIEMLDQKTLNIAVPKQRGLNDLFGKLAEQNVEVLSLKNKTNRLEQLFMDLVDGNYTAYEEQ